jgi:hypothetical protein
MDEGRKRVVGIIAAIMASLHNADCCMTCSVDRWEPQDGQADRCQHPVVDEDHGEDR